MGYHPHHNPHWDRILLSTCLRIHCNMPYYCLPDTELLVGFLRTCRQAYHEARNVFYTANIFRIGDPIRGRTFLQRISDYNLVLRSIHLTIHIFMRNDERQWNSTLHQLAENFKTVQNLYIDIEQDLWSDEADYHTGRYSPALGKRPFLKGLLELNKLPLKTFEICVDTGSPRVYHLAQAGDYTWTWDQKRAWAQSMKSAILGKD